MLQRIRQIRDDERGLTLTELMVSVMLLTIVSVILTSTLVSTTLATRDVQNAAVSNDNVRLVIQTLDREVRSAERICLPTPGTSGNTLSFRTRAWVATPPPLGYRDIIYQLNPDAGGDLTVLQKSEDNGVTWRTVIENVENVSIGEDLFENQGDVTTALPSQGKVITVRAWVDANLNDRVGAELATTEISGRNIWTPTAQGC